MKTFKKILIAFFSILLLVAIGGYFYINHMATKSLPEYNGEITLKGFKDKVVIRRDNFAIPHIIASNEEDLYRATGYVIAQDRLWQMDLIRRATMGRLSELFGADFVDVDLKFRALRISDKSKLVLENTDTTIRIALQAFADGINLYMENQMDKLPPEFLILGYKPEPWKIEHSANLIGYMAWDLTSSWESEVLLHQLHAKLDSVRYSQILPNLAKQKTYTYGQEKLAYSEMEYRTSLLSATSKLRDLGIDVFSGSNNWAVSGKKSTTGQPILANDMHLGFGAPGIWYQIHQVVEGKLDVSGLMLPGAPFVICGHNNAIAWGMTNVMVDDMDFYLETVNPENENQYKLDGVWKDMQIRNELIATKEGDTIQKTLRFTHRGPIVSQFHQLTERAVSMRWTGNDYSNELRTIYLLNRAQNWDEFKNALRSFNALGQNVVYADIQGNIGLYSAMSIPKRKGDPAFLYPGETSEYDWQGIVPFDSLPHEYNPERGYVSSANCRTAPPDYPYYISYWFDMPYRMDRIREMLEAKDKLSIDDFKNMQNDHKSKLPEVLLPGIFKGLEGIAGLDKNQQKALGYLKNWDGILNAESQATAIFEYFYNCFIKNMIADEMDDELFGKFISNKTLTKNMVQTTWQNPESPWYDNIKTTGIKEGFNEIVQKSFKDALDSLKTKLGPNPDNWKWGDIHTFTVNHPLGKVGILNFAFKLNKGPFPVGGSFHTVSPYAYSFKKIFPSNHGASHRSIYSLANWDESISVIPTGICGIPASPHYCDQTEIYVNKGYHDDFFDILKIEKTSKYRLTIHPANR
jgi:penicillin G amidase